MMENLLSKLSISKYKLFFMNRGGRILPLILLTIFLSACGIAVHYYLNPPVKFTTLNFYHAYNNDPDYAMGYDFFYRIYDGDNTTENTIINEANAFFTDNNLLELLFSNKNLITDSYFKRILPVWDDISTDFNLSTVPIPTVTTPIMKIDPNYFNKDDSSKKFSILVSISSDGTGKIESTGYVPSASYPSVLNFKRYVTTNNTDFVIKSFLDIDESYDDIPLLGSSITIDIAFFVVLYGKTENYVPIFSDVVYIGSVNDLSF